MACLGKVTRHFFMVHHDVAHDDAAAEACVQIGLFKSHAETLPQLHRATRQKLGGMLEHLGVLGVDR